MALNNNHIFEDLEETRCSVVEKNCNAGRAEFIRRLLEHNGFKVITVLSPAPKGAGGQKSAATENSPPASPADPTFTVGVTDVSFNLMNAIYNRELRIADGKIVSPAYWKESFSVTAEETGYWEIKR